MYVATILQKKYQSVYIHYGNQSGRIHFFSTDWTFWLQSYRIVNAIPAKNMSTHCRRRISPWFQAQGALFTSSF